MEMKQVWDWQTRVLHWLIALLVITLALLMIGKEGMELIGVEKALREPVKRLHAYVGYAFVLVFVIRVVWGFVGNEYARWSDIVPWNRERLRAAWTNVRWYLGLLRGRPADVLGHDPLASILYMVLFAVFFSQALTGLLLSGIEFNMFPGSVLTGGVSAPALEEMEEVMGEVHEAGFWYIIFFAIAHLIGLMAHELKEKKGLFSSMIHGSKYTTKEDG